MADQVRDLIVKTASDRGETLASLSRKVGRNHAYLQQFVQRGVPKGLPEGVRRKLAELLELDERALGGPEMAAGERPAVLMPTPIRGNARIGAALQWAGTVPLMGQGAAGPDGRFEFNGERVTDILAPPSLASVRGAYAVYVVGDSMEPRYYSGEVIFVDPNRPTRRGDFVVVQVGGADGEPPAGYIKRLVSREARFLKLEQFNPRKVLQIPAQRVLSVHRIVMAGQE